MSTTKTKYRVTVLETSKRTREMTYYALADDEASAHEIVAAIRGGNVNLGGVVGTEIVFDPDTTLDQYTVEPA